MGLACVQYGIQHADRVWSRRCRAACDDVVSIDEIKREEIFRKREVHPKLFPFFRDTSPCVDIRASLLVDFVLRVQK